MFARASIGLLVILVLVSCDQRDVPVNAKPGSPAQPAISFVEVAPGIKLEVLDWSTEGPPVVLLAGATDTAHIYEDFAPYFTDRFRVIGITRRRHGASAVPQEDFGIKELADDVIAVLDAKRIDKALFVAASFGGAELSHIAARYPQRVQKMAFLDAGWDFFDTYYAEGWWDGWPDVPMTDQDKASPQAVASYVARTVGAVYPIAEILARNRFDAGGRLVARDPNIGNMFQGMIRSSLKPLEYAGFDKPTLLVRSIPRTVEDMFPGYKSFDPDNQQRAKDAFEKWIRVLVPAADRFAERVPSAQELRIDGGLHDVAVGHAGRIVPVLREFLLK